VDDGPQSPGHVLVDSDSNRSIQHRGQPKLGGEGDAKSVSERILGGEELDHIAVA
jgi:hypothetical protein